MDGQSSVLPGGLATGRRRDTLRRWVRPKRVAAAVVVVIAVAIAAKVLSDSSDELLSAADSLTDLVLGWVVVALTAKIASYLARGAGQSLLLREAPDALPPGSRPPGAVVLGAGTLAGDAAAYCAKSFGISTASRTISAPDLSALARYVSSPRQASPLSRQFLLPRTLT